MPPFGRAMTIISPEWQPWQALFANEHRLFHERTLRKNIELARAAKLFQGSNFFT
jgi:hypothetical protein